MAENAKETEAEAKAFLDAAVEKDYLTAEQAADAIESHKKVAELGLHEKIAVILVKKEYMSEEQVRAVRRAMGGAHRIAGYELMEKIGQGSMGAVFRARQLSMDRTVAVKILPPKIAANKAFTERFMREARAVAKLNHINIIQGIDVGQSGDYFYFAMEYVDGPTVRELLMEKGRLTEKESLSIAMQIARALDHAWKHGMVHRDVKPDNIMITSSGIAKLCDLGLVRRTEDDVHGERSGVAVGTPYYISPEQARGESDVDIRADIYSLGATLYHMLTGVTPFDGSSAAIVMTKHLTEVVPNPQDRVDELGDGTVRIIEMMMAKERDERYQNPTELLRDIELVMDKKEPKRAKLFKGESSIMPAVRRRRRTRQTEETEEALKKIPTGMLIAGAGAAVSIVAVILVIAFSMTSDGDSKPPPKRPRNSKAPPAEKNPPTVAVPKRTNRPSAADVARAKEMFEYAMAQMKKSPGDYASNIKKLRDVKQQTRGTVYSMKASDEIERLTKERDSKVQASFDAAKKRADAFVARRQFGKGLEAMAGFPQPMRFGPWLSKYTKACGDIRKAADAHWTDEMKKSDGLAQSGKFRDARKVVEALRSMAMPETAARVDKALENLQAREAKWKADEEKRRLALVEKQKAEARQAYIALVQKNGGLVRKGSIDAAVAATRRARSACKVKELRPSFDKELEDLKAIGELREIAADTMTRAERVSITWRGKEMSGKVSSRRGDRLWIKRGGLELPVEMKDLAADDILKYSGCTTQPKLAPKATAFLILTGDVKEAYKWLDRTSDAAEKERLTGKLAILSKGAEQAAVDHLMSKIAEQHKAKNWAAMRAGIDSLKETYGKSGPYKKVAGEIENMLFDAGTAESGGLASIIHGRVRKFSGLKVEVQYDFSKAEQYPDWLKVRGQGSREGSGLTLWGGKEACARPAMVWDSIDYFEFDAKNLSDKNQHLGWSLAQATNPYSNPGCWAWMRPNGDSAIEAHQVKIGANPKITTQKNSVYRMRVEIRGNVVTWLVNGKRVATWDANKHKRSLRGLFPYVNTWGSKAVFDNFKIMGTLSKKWVEDRLKLHSLLRGKDVVPGLVGEHWNNGNLKGRADIRSIYAQIDHDWHRNVPIGGVGHDNFSVRWTGKLLLTKGGDYQFWCEVDDGGRVYIDGKRVFDHWGFKGGWHKFNVKGLTEGLHEWKVEMHEGAGDSRCRLDWQPPGAKRHRMPPSVFYCDRGEHAKVVKEIEARRKRAEKKKEG